MYLNYFDLYCAHHPIANVFINKQTDAQNFGLSNFEKNDFDSLVALNFLYARTLFEENHFLRVEYSWKLKPE